MNKFLFISLSATLVSLNLAMSPLTAHASSDYSIDLRIQTPEGELFHDWLSVPKNCTVMDTTGIQHELTDHAALCAVQVFADQTGETVEVENSSYGLFLSGIAQHDQDTAQGLFWLYRVNDVSPFVGLDAYALADQDAVLLTLGAWPSSPVEVSLSAVDLLKNGSLVASVTAFNDETGEFEPLESATVYAGKSKYKTFTTDETGKAKLTFNKTGDFNVFASKQDYTTSEVTHVRVRATTDSSEFVDRAQRQKLLTGALNWLTNQVDSHGKIDSIGITEWAAMAFARADQSMPKTMRQAILNYDPDKSSATDLERHILALKAVYGNPHDQNGQNYVQQLYANHVHDGQIGDEAYLNDDIFGVLALLSAGQEVNSTELKQTIRFILQHQLPDGSFSYSTSLTTGDADTTAAALRTLRRARHRGSVVALSPAMHSARLFLDSVQRMDGGFAYDSPTIDSNSSTTAWVALGLAHPSQWKVNKRQPWTYLSWTQQGDGSFAWMVGSDGDPLTTAYVAEALADSLQ